MWWKSEIAILVASSPQSITNLRVRLLQKLFNETGGAKDFDQRICHYGEDYRTTLTL